MPCPQYLKLIISKKSERRKEIGTKNLGPDIGRAVKVGANFNTEEMDWGKLQAGFFCQTEDNLTLILLPSITVWRLLL